MDNSTYRKLPAELRVIILEHVLYTSNDDGLLTYKSDRPRFSPWMIANHRRAVTTVCRIFRMESHPIFYRFASIRFFPLDLDKYEPDFFTARNSEKELMMWEYLGNPLDSFTGFLDHIGEDGKKNLQHAEVHIGTWDLDWASNQNSLVHWLTRDLAGVVRLFEGSATQITLHFNLGLPDFHYGRYKIVDIVLPISDIAAAHEVLADVILREKKDATNRFYYSTRRRFSTSSSAIVYFKSTLRF